MHCVEFFCICLMAVLIAGVHSKNLNKTTRIMGGDIITIDKAPHIVQLTLPNKEGFFCGGSLIAPRFVVTAAHCVYDVNYEEVVVVGGTDKLNKTGVERKVINGYINGEYNHTNYDADVAILELEDDMKGDNITTISLSKHSLQTRDDIVISGWGSSKWGGELSNDLHSARVKVVDQEQCKNLHFVGEITDNMVCAADKGKDACTSDSGGPAVFRGELAGIISWGIGCGRKTNPGVYTRIDEVLWFIDEVIKPKK